MCASPREIIFLPFYCKEIELPNSPPMAIPSPFSVDLRVCSKNVPIGMFLNILIPLLDILPSYLIPSSPEVAKANA